MWTLSGGVGCCLGVGGYPEEVAAAALRPCSWGPAVEGDGEGSGEGPDGCSGFPRILFATLCALFRSGIVKIFAGGV